MTEFGALLKKARKNKNMTQKQLGQLTGFSQNSISQHESGTRLLNEQDIKIYAKALNIEVSDLTNRKSTFDDSKIRKIFTQLNSSNQAELTSIADKMLKSQNVIQFPTKKQSTEITVYGAVSAGRGEYLDAITPETITIEGAAPAHDFAVRVNGDSMEPLFQNGQYIFINKVEDTSLVRNNQIVIAVINGDSYVKKFSHNQETGECKLISLNKKYPDIKINNDDDFKIVGAVVL